jgi:hypothetical protein
VDSASKVELASGIPTCYSGTAEYLKITRDTHLGLSARNFLAARFVHDQRLSLYLTLFD